MRKFQQTNWFFFLGVVTMFMFFAAHLKAQENEAQLKQEGFCSAAQAAKNDGIKWETDLKTAMAKGRRLDKPVFVVFLCRFLGDCNSPYA